MAEAAVGRDGGRGVSNNDSNSGGGSDRGVGGQW